ncbi:hypothetical protein BGZ68_006399 [Mortierella alpina]|nr:hypothetical protein BGZ68_006399 [Mortierella alpina]
MNTLPDPCQRLVAQHLPVTSIRALLYLNKHWLTFAASILYRDPFQTLRELPLGVEEDKTTQRLIGLLELLLRCCFDQAHLTTVPPSESTLDDDPPSSPSPLVDYLALYTDQSSRYYSILSGRGYSLWHKGTLVPAKDRYDRVRIAFASHRPENVAHLYCSMSSLAPLTALAPHFSKLQSLRILQVSGKNESIEPLNAFTTRHRSSHRISELRDLSFVNLAFSSLYHPLIGTTDPITTTTTTTTTTISSQLALNHWTNLQRLDLTLYQGIVDWHLIPRRSLVDLRFSIQSMSTPFEPSELLRPCARLETLHILNLEKSSLTWLKNQPAQPAIALLPRLHTLGLGGTITGLIPSLAIAVDVFSERLLSLTISLQQEKLQGDQQQQQRPERIIFTGNNRIMFQQPLPNLTELVLRDHALFELNAMVLTGDQCPSLRILDLGVNAERSGPGCTEMGVGWTVKWIKFRNVFRRIQARKEKNSNAKEDDDDTLEELRIRGFFCLPSVGLVDIIRPFKRLKRLYLGEARYLLDRNSTVTNTWVSDIVQGHKDLTFLQATQSQMEGWKDTLPPGLELSLTGYNSLFEQIDEQEVVPL